MFIEVAIFVCNDYNLPFQFALYLQFREVMTYSSPTDSFCVASAHPCTGSTHPVVLLASFDKCMCVYDVAQMESLFFTRKTIHNHTTQSYTEVTWAFSVTCLVSTWVSTHSWLVHTPG